MVAMNPTFDNPAFDFTWPTITRNVISGAQTAAGTVIGVAASKAMNDLVAKPLVDKFFKTTKQSLLQRLVVGAIAGGITSTLARSFVPGDLGDRLADGAFAGGMLYVAGGIQLDGKPIIPIGDMIGGEVSGKDKDKIYLDQAVQAPVQSSVQSYDIQPDASPEYRQVEVSDYMAETESDSMDSGVGSYDYQF